MARDNLCSFMTKWPLNLTWPIFLSARLYKMDTSLPSGTFLTVGKERRRRLPVRVPMRDGAGDSNGIDWKLGFQWLEGLCWPLGPEWAS